MKRTLRIGLVFLAIFLTQAVYASGKEGGGGKGVVCRNSAGNILSVQGLDYYEAGTRGIQINLGAPNLSVREKIALALSRLTAIGDVNRAEQYAKTVDTFLSPEGTRYLANTHLTDIDDTYETSFPDGCKPEQIIIQKQPELQEDRLFTVSQDLWNKLDNDNQAMLILHEAIYQEAMSLGATDSYMSRYFNSYICANKLTEYPTIDQYAALLVKFKFVTVTFGGVLLDISGGNNLGAPVIVSGNEILANPVMGTLAHIDGADFILWSSTISAGMSFYKSGAVKVIHSNNGYNLTPDPDSPAYSVPDVKLSVAGEHILFDAEGGRFEFFEDGKINSGPLAERHSFVNAQGDTVDCASESIVTFDENGKLLRCPAPQQLKAVSALTGQTYVTHSTAGKPMGTFTQVQGPGGFGLSWMDPSGTIWSADQGEFTNNGDDDGTYVTQSDATDACAKIGGILPTINDYKMLVFYLEEAYGRFTAQGRKDENALFPDMSKHVYWTSSLSKVSSETQTFEGLWGDFGDFFRDGVYFVRCVSR